MQRRRDDIRARVDNRRKRYMRRRMATTFVVLAFITAVGVAAALFASFKGEKEKEDSDAVAANADVPEKSAKNESGTDAETVPISEGEEGTGDTPEDEEGEPEVQPVQAGASSKEGILEEANRLAASYDYDGAMEKVKSFAGYEGDAEMTEAIAGYEAQKAACVPVKID